MMTENGCAFCGEPARLKDRGDLYCSAKCRGHLRRRREREAAGIVTPTACKVCSGPIPRAKPNKLHCSNACLRASAYQATKERLAAKMEETAPKDRQCIECGGCFQPNWRKPGPTPNFCSLKCRRKSQMRRFRQREKQDPNRIKSGAFGRPKKQAVAKGCANCSHWGAKGCALEAFRFCNPGVASRHWKEKEAA